MYQRTYKMRKKLLAPGDPELVESQSKLTELLAKIGKPAEAEALRREAGEKK